MEYLEEQKHKALEVSWNLISRNHYESKGLTSWMDVYAKSKITSTQTEP